jgi:hypothetical protein
MINFQIHTNGVNVEKKILLLSPHISLSLIKQKQIPFKEEKKKNYLE